MKRPHHLPYAMWIAGVDKYLDAMVADGCTHRHFPDYDFAADHAVAKTMKATARRVIRLCVTKDTCIIT